MKSWKIPKNYSEAVKGQTMQWSNEKGQKDKQ
jgi:hypothetical protein